MRLARMELGVHGTMTGASYEDGRWGSALRIPLYSGASSNAPKVEIPSEAWLGAKDWTAMVWVKDSSPTFSNQALYMEEPSGELVAGHIGALGQGSAAWVVECGRVCVLAQCKKI